MTGVFLIGTIAALILPNSETDRKVVNSVIAPDLHEVDSHSSPPAFIETLKSWPDMIRIVRNGEAAYDEFQNQITIPIRLSVDSDQYRDWTQRLLSESQATAEHGDDVVMQRDFPVHIKGGLSDSHAHIVKLHLCVHVCVLCAFVRCVLCCG